MCGGVVLCTQLYVKIAYQNNADLPGKRQYLQNGSAWMHTPTRAAARACSEVYYTDKVKQEEATVASHPSAR